MYNDTVCVQNAEIFSECVTFIKWGVTTCILQLLSVLLSLILCVKYVCGDCLKLNISFEIIADPVMKTIPL